MRANQRNCPLRRRTLRSPRLVATPPIRATIAGRRVRAGRSLWADGTALQLVADVLEAAFVRHGLLRKQRRNGTEADHAERAEAVKSYLAGRLGERVKLEEVARAVHASPFHLARVFQQRTDVPIHRYLTQLRLRAALERLADGTDDLTRLALELGFSSHSHFTDAFRRALRRTPSEARNDTGCPALLQMSKNLKV
jgi:AraC family transcriptional regulator